VPFPQVDEAHPMVASAGRLVSALLFNRDEDFRLALLKRVARKLGESDGYPTFIKLLTTVSESADEPGKRALAATLAIGLRRNDLPSGQLTAWGASRLWQAGSPAGGNLGSQLFGAAPHRSFGPIEYLTAWFGQGTQRIRLGAEVYADALRRLIDLVNADSDAHALYPRKLEADTQLELEGIYMRGTRDRLATIASAWSNGVPSVEIAAAAVASGNAESGARVPRDWVVRDL
jgi:hypothetical protein